MAFIKVMCPNCGPEIVSTKDVWALTCVNPYILTYNATCPECNQTTTYESDHQIHDMLVSCGCREEFVEVENPISEKEIAGFHWLIRHSDESLIWEELLA